MTHTWDFSWQANRIKCSVLRERRRGAECRLGWTSAWCATESTWQQPSPTVCWASPRPRFNPPHSHLGQVRCPRWHSCRAQSCTATEVSLILRPLPLIASSSLTTCLTSPPGPKTTGFRPFFFPTNVLCDSGQVSGFLWALLF